MSTLEAQAPVQTRASRALAFVGGFHLWMAVAISTLLIISLAGCALTGIETPGRRLSSWFYRRCCYQYRPIGTRRAARI